MPAHRPVASCSGSSSHQQAVDGRATSSPSTGHQRLSRVPTCKRGLLPRCCLTLRYKRTPKKCLFAGKNSGGGIDTQSCDRRPPANTGLCPPNRGVVPTRIAGVIRERRASRCLQDTRLPQIGLYVRRLRSAPDTRSRVARCRRDARFAASCVLDAAGSAASRSS